MIKRIVRLSFQPELVNTFLEVFEDSKSKIRNFQGCIHMELLNSTNESNIFFTLSYWESEEALELYRHSPLFKATWAKTKVLFNDKPHAWSTVVVDDK